AIEQTAPSIRRADADQQRTRKPRQAGSHRTISLLVRRCRAIVAIKRNLVHDHEPQRATTNLAIAVGRNGNIDTVVELKTTGGLPPDHATERLDLFEK